MKLKQKKKRRHKSWRRDKRGRGKWERMMINKAPAWTD